MPSNVLGVGRLDSALNLSQHQSANDSLINLRPRLSLSVAPRPADRDDQFGTGLADDLPGAGNDSIELGRAAPDARNSFRDSLSRSRASLDGTVERGRDAPDAAPAFNDSVVSKAGRADIGPLLAAGTACRLCGWAHPHPP
jgi:hypothetical protein